MIELFELKKAHHNYGKPFDLYFYTTNSANRFNV